MIEKLKLRNFKNYENQEISFPRTNGFFLIAGPNGSGKSGIGEAIGLCLGLTGLMGFIRQSGRKITNLIKEDSEESKIALILNNEEKNGSRPFNSDVNNIEIIRVIRRDGSSSFKVKGLPKTLNSLKELHEIANFNESNPFIFIPQGKLSDLIPIDLDRKTDIKYLEEFEKITGLTELRKKMLETFENLSDSKKLLDILTTKHYEPASRYLNEIGKTFKLFIDLELKKLELQGSKLGYHLIQKYNNKKDLDNLTGEMENARKEHAQVIEQLDRVNKDILDLKESKEDIQNRLREKQELLEHLQNNESSLKYETDMAQNIRDKEDYKLKNLKSRLYEIEVKIKKLEEQRKILSKDTKEDLKSKELLKELNKLEAELKELDEEYDKKLSNIKENFILRAGSVNNKIKNEKNFFEIVNGIKDNIKKIERELNDKNSRYNPDLFKVLSFIQKQNIPVYGPAGNYIQVIYPEAWNAVEIALGYDILHSFITFNELSQKTLDNFLIKNKIESISVYSFPEEVEIPSFNKTIDLPSGVLGPVIDLIDITDEKMKLIINESYGKQWVVCQDESTAHDFTKKYRKTSISLNGLIKRPTRYGSGLSSKFRKARRNILSVGSRKEELKKLMEDLKMLQDIKNEFELKKQGIIDVYERESRSKNEIIEDIKYSLKGQSTALMEIQVKIDENNKELKRIKEEMGTSETILDENSSSHNELTKAMDIIKADIESCKSEISRYESDLEKICRTLEINNSLSEELQTKLGIIDFLGMENEIKRFEDHLKEITDKITELLTDLRHKHQIIGDQLKTASPIQLQLLDPQETLLTSILNLEDQEELQNWELLEIHDDIIKLETIISTTQIPDDIVEKYTEAKRELDALEQEKKDLEIIIESRESEYKKNFEDWFEKIKNLIEKLKIKFKEYIESINGTGYIKISNLEDPTVARMDLFASFKENAPPRSIASHTHSGGEKTMIIMAFILSIQSLKPQPFYILDEPDAHLDPENRDRLFRMIKEASQETQYMVISPQENREKHTIPDVIYYLFNNDGRTIIKQLS